MLNLGHVIESSEIQRGLSELSPDLQFDLPLRRPSDYRFVFDPAAIEECERQRKGQCGIYHLGRYICAMDRGSVPEFKVWEKVRAWRPIEFSDRQLYEDTRCSYRTVGAGDRGYHEALSKAERNTEGYDLLPDRRVRIWSAQRLADGRGRVIKLGWRHTFEGLLAARIDGITRHRLGARFGVDMLKVPVGEIGDVVAALTEE